MKICLVCASGGHLTEMLKISDAFKDKDVFLITYEEEFLSKYSLCNSSYNINRVYFIKNYVVSSINKKKLVKLLNYIRQILVLFAEEILIFIREKPDIIISTGSGIAIPIFIFAKPFRRKLIFIESLCRIKNLSMTARIILPIVDIMLVQWKDLVRKYKKARYEGNILKLNFMKQSNTYVNENSEDFIFVTAGTSSFYRLIQKMDEYAGQTGKNIIIIIGRTEYKPHHSKYFKFIEKEYYSTLIQKAKIVVTHAGIGTIIEVLESNKPMIIVPRSKDLDEAFDNHQQEIAELMKGFPNVKVVYSVNEIPQAIESLQKTSFIYKQYDLPYDRGRLIKFLRDYLDKEEKLQKK